MASSITTTQTALGANVATALYGVTGAGVKIGIINVSFNSTGGAAADMAAGILPNVTVLSDGTGSNEGRAMIEDAYSVASGAQYYFAAPGSGAGGFAQAVAALQNAGCNIIIDDLTVGGEAFYQNGTATDLGINAAVAAGVDYFTSAGNNGTDYYEQGFKPLSVTIAGIGDVTANDFGGGSPYLSLTLPANFTSNLMFQYAQPFSSIGSSGNGPTNSLGIYLLDDSGKVVASAAFNNVGKEDPTNNIMFNNTTANTSYRLVVVQNGGVVPAGELFKLILNDAIGTINNPNAGTGSGSLIGHEDLPGINVIGAVAYTNTPAFGVSPAVAEAYSSAGPGAILFDAQGNPLATPLVLNEPQFDAPDNSSFPAAGTNNHFAPFPGTSAAAPAAGATAALVLEANPKLSTTQITSILAQSVIPAVGTGYNGAGLIQARAAVEIAAADAGDRWDKAVSNNWVDSARWSDGRAPTDKQAVSLSDNLGTSTGKYTVTVDSTGNRAGSLAISAPAASEATLDVTTGGTLDIGGPKAGDITAGDFLVSDNGRLRVTGGTLKVSGSLNVNNGVADIASGLAEANNYAQDAGSLTLGGSGKAATLKLTGTGFEETGGTASFKSAAMFDTKSLSDSAGSFLITASDATVKDSGVASFTNNAIFENKGTFEDTASVASKAGAAFTNTTVTNDGRFTADLASLTKSTFTDKGSWIDKGALSLDSTTGMVDRGGSIEVGSLSVGVTYVGFGSTLTDAGTITDKGDLGIGSSANGGTVALTSSGTLIVAGTVNTNLNLTFLGGGLLDFSSRDSNTLQDELQATINGFKAGSGKIDFSGLAYKADDTYAYNSRTGDLSIQDPKSILANVFLNTDTNANYSGGFTLRADANNHIEVLVAPTRMA